MIYIFEDKPDDILSILFQSAYTDTSNFVYANGAGRIYNIAEDILKNTDNTVGIYLDMIPGNNNCRKIYYKLRSLAHTYTGRVVILPIVCSEYYFIRSIVHSHVIKNKVGLYECINRMPFMHSKLIEPKDKEYCKNFEKYCKLFLIKNLHDCAKHSRGVNNENQLYGIYYTQDCRCEANLEYCDTLTLRSKSLNLLKEYPCIPVKSIFSSNRTRLSDIDMQMVHKRLVDEYNDMVDKYAKYDINNSNKYKKITYAIS